MLLPLSNFPSIANSYRLNTHCSIWRVKLDVLFIMHNTFFVYAAPGAFFTLDKIFSFSVLFTS